MVQLPKNTKLKVLIADRSPIVRYGLEKWINARENFEVVGVAQSIQTLQRLLLPCVAEILVMDLSLLEDNAASKWKKMQSQTVDIKLVSYGLDSVHDVQRAIDCGAAAHILKTEDLRSLDVKLVSIHLGNSHPIKMTHESSAPGDSAGITPPRLSNREIEVLRLIATGMTSIEISALLGIRPRTVNTHRTNISHKLNIHRLADLITYAIRARIVEQD